MEVRVGPRAGQKAVAERNIPSFAENQTPDDRQSIYWLSYPTSCWNYINVHFPGALLRTRKLMNSSKGWEFDYMIDC
jgi:hypothetical protein